ncbi:unnamed protein product [Aphanomyces euteiches]
MEEAKKLVDSLGMRWDDNLHDGVTHLVAIVVGSAKYKAAKAAKMKVVKIEWLHACFQNGAAVPTGPFELKPLEGLCICTTGLYVEDRDKVQELCESMGGIYHPDLIFGTTTHLIAEHPEGAKYNTAIAYGIPVVTVDWIVACLDAQELQDEDPYRVKEQDKEEDDAPTYLKLNDQLAQCIGMLEDDSIGFIFISCCVLRHELHLGCFFDGCIFWVTSGFPPDVMQKIKLLIRFGMGTRYDTYNSSVTHIVADYTGRCQHLKDTNDGVEIVSTNWLIDSALAMTCMQEDSYPPRAQPLPERPPTTTPTKTLTKALINTAQKIIPAAPPLAPQPQSLFGGHMFLLLYTDKLGSTGNAVLRAQIKEAGGRYREINTTDPRILQPNDIARMSHIILGHGCELPDGMLPSLCQAMPHAKLATELWLQCCLQDGIIYPRRKHKLFRCSADAHASSFPPLPLPCFDSMVACISMFVDVERAVLSCLLRLAGATLTLKLSKRNTHLVCRLPEGPKFEKAVEWKLAIVNAKWLITSVSAATLMELPAMVPPSKKRKLEPIDEDLPPAILSSQETKELSQEEPRPEAPPTASLSQEVKESSREEPCEAPPPVSSEEVEGGALTQLDNLLGDMGGNESCSLDYRYEPILPVAVAEAPKTAHVNSQFFADSQAVEPNSEMVHYVDMTQSKPV